MLSVATEVCLCHDTLNNMHFWPPVVGRFRLKFDIFRMFVVRMYRFYLNGVVFRRWDQHKIYAPFSFRLPIFDGEWSSYKAGTNTHTQRQYNSLLFRSSPLCLDNVCATCYRSFICYIIITRYMPAYLLWWMNSYFDCLPSNTICVYFYVFVLRWGQASYVCLGIFRNKIVTPEFVRSNRC